MVDALQKTTLKFNDLVTTTVVRDGLTAWLLDTLSRSNYHRALSILISIDLSITILKEFGIGSCG